MLIVLLEHDMNTFDPHFSGARLRDTSFLPNSKVWERGKCTKDYARKEFRKPPLTEEVDLHVFHRERKEGDETGYITAPTSNHFFEPKSFNCKKKDTSRLQKD